MTRKVYPFFIKRDRISGWYIGLWFSTSSRKTI